LLLAAVLLLAAHGGWRWGGKRSGNSYCAEAARRMKVGRKRRGDSHYALGAKHGNGRKDVRREDGMKYRRTQGWTNGRTGERENDRAD
jgi:hypothetical protein